MSMILPGDIPIYNVTNVQPFTEKDGRTYLQILMDLRKYLNTELVDGINTNTAELMAWVNTAIANMEAGVVNDSSFLAVVSDVDGETRLYLDNLYLGQTTTDGDVRTFVLDVDGLTRVALDGLYAGQRTTNADVAAYIDDDEGATREALDMLYAGQGATDGQVNALVENPASATRSSLNDLYAGQAATDAGVAVFVTGPGDTRTALDGLYAGQGATDDSVNGLIEDEDSDTRTTLDSLYGGSSAALDDEVSALIVNPASDTRVQLDGLYTGGGGGVSDSAVNDIVADDATETRSTLDGLYGGGIPQDADYNFHVGSGDIDPGAQYNIVFGQGAKALDDASYGTAVGFDVEVSGVGTMYATALGFSSEAQADRATALGSNANASGEDSVSVGSTVMASGTQAIAVGAGATASGANAIAIGASTNALGDNTLALGQGAYVDTPETALLKFDRISFSTDSGEFVFTVVNNVLVNNGKVLPWSYQPGTNDGISQGYAVIEQREIIQLRTFVDGGGNWVSTPLSPVSKTAHLTDTQRLAPGFMYFNETLGMPVWLKTHDPDVSSNNVWVDATGTVVP